MPWDTRSKFPKIKVDLHWTVGLTLPNSPELNWTVGVPASTKCWLVLIGLGAVGDGSLFCLCLFSGCVGGSVVLIGLGAVGDGSLFCLWLFSGCVGGSEERRGLGARFSRVGGRKLNSRFCLGTASFTIITSGSLSLLTEILRIRYEQFTK